MAEKFLFSQYAVSDDTVDVVIRGVPMSIRRALNIHERKKVQDKLIKVTVGPDGKPKFGSPDMTEYTIEICLLAIKSWPFVMDDGVTPVPINRETVTALDPAFQDEVAGRVLGYYEEVNKEADPFESKSEEPS